MRLLKRRRLRWCQWKTATMFPRRTASRWRSFNRRRSPTRTATRSPIQAARLNRYMKQYWKLLRIVGLSQKRFAMKSQTGCARLSRPKCAVDIRNELSGVIVYPIEYKYISNCIIERSWTCIWSDKVLAKIQPILGVLQKEQPLAICSSFIWLSPDSKQRLQTKDLCKYCGYLIFPPSYKLFSRYNVGANCWCQWTHEGGWVVAS